MKCFSNKWAWLVVALVAVFFIIVWFVSKGNLVEFFGG